MTSMRKLRRRETAFLRYWKRYERRLGYRFVFCGPGFGRALGRRYQEMGRRNPVRCFDCNQPEPCACPDVPS